MKYKRTFTRLINALRREQKTVVQHRALGWGLARAVPSPPHKLAETATAPRLYPYVSNNGTTQNDRNTRIALLIGQKAPRTAHRLLAQLVDFSEGVRWRRDASRRLNNDGHLTLQRAPAFPAPLLRSLSPSLTALLQTPTSLLTPQNKLAGGK